MSDMLNRWRENVEWGILSIGREWDKSGCQCDPSVGAVPCHYCAEHGAILAGESMLAEIERLRSALRECWYIAGGDGIGDMGQRCVRILSVISGAYGKKKVEKAVAGEIERLQLRINQLETECGHLQADLGEFRDAAREIWARRLTCDEVYARDLKRWPWLKGVESE